MKKFFKKTEGFTLVELIVVIAILGILAGVGTVGYSGYIKKAQVAADNQIVAAVNTAFAAACMENGVDPKTVTSAEVEWTANDTIDGLTSVVIPNDVARATLGPKATKVVAAFDKYFAGNTGSKFKVFDKLGFANGSFYGIDEDDPSAASGGIFGEIFTSLSDSISGSVTAVKNSEFGEIGAAGLMNKLGLVTDLSNELAVGADSSQAYRNFLMNGELGLIEALGYKPEELDEDEELAAKYAEDFEAMIQAKMAKDGTDRDTAYYGVLTNYAVLNAASNTDTSKTAAQLAAGVENGTLTGEMLKSLMKQNDQGALGDAAMMYGMYTAWANGLDDDDAQKAQAVANASTINGFINDMDNEAFLTYLKDADGNAQKDLDGYFGAMDIINKASANNPEAVTELLINGYEDPNLLAALQDLLK